MINLKGRLPNGFKSDDHHENSRLHGPNGQRLMRLNLYSNYLVDFLSSLFFFYVYMNFFFFFFFFFLGFFFFFFSGRSCRLFNSGNDVKP